MKTIAEEYKHLTPEGVKEFSNAYLLLLTFFALVVISFIFDGLYQHSILLFVSSLGIGIVICGLFAIYNDNDKYATYIRYRKVSE
jgi:hypothetical protein